MQMEENEKIRLSWRKYGKISGLLLLGILVVALLGNGIRAWFRMDGFVTVVQPERITVTGFFRSQVVELAGTSVEGRKFFAGDRVIIQKNWQGEVMYISVNPEYSHHNRKSVDREFSRHGG